MRKAIGGVIAAITLVMAAAGCQGGATMSAPATTQPVESGQPTEQTIDASTIRVVPMRSIWASLRSPASTLYLDIACRIVPSSPPNLLSRKDFASSMARTVARARWSDPIMAL